MKCNQCGFESEGKFCSNCGTPFEQKSQEAEAPQVEETQAESADDAQAADNTEVFETETADNAQAKMPTDNVDASVSSAQVSPQNMGAPAPSKTKKYLTYGVIAFIVLGITGNFIKKDPANSSQNSSSQITQAEPVPEKNMVVLDDFTNKSQEEIEKWAEEHKIRCSFSEYYSDDVKAGLCSKQSPKAGESVEENAKVYVTISKGKQPPREYENALASAETYSRMMHMSKRGIYEQLVSEYGDKFPADAAQYAIDNLDADYKENALKTARTYQDDLHMSSSAIYDQLTSDYGEKFTPEEAQYAIDHL